MTLEKHTILQQYFGYTEFRKGQELSIDALLEGRDVVGIMPTGAGKSLCYQIPALAMSGISIIISPLISLMKDQVMSLKEVGISAAYLNSSLTQEQCQIVLHRAMNRQYKIIYVAPERLRTASFLHFAKSAEISTIIVDEAHCISQWGQNFRPDYLAIADFISMLPKRPPVGAFTATATARVTSDIIGLLRLCNPLVVSTGFDRPNLTFEVDRHSVKYLALIRFLENRVKQSGIVYCATRKIVEEVYSFLSRDGYNVTLYHAGLSSEERKRNQEAFQNDQKAIMIATSAFGMGIDKSNVSFVVHYNMPQSLEAYYQEAGRAGRDGSPAHCLLLYSKQDVIIAKWLIQHGIKNPGATNEDRAIVEANELERLKQMTFYATTSKCLRNMLLHYFGEVRSTNCGNCGNCLHISDSSAKTEPQSKVSKTSISSSRENIPHACKTSPETNSCEELYQKLKALRNEIAKESNVPAYIIFTDATLLAFAQLRPQTLDQMAEIQGVGAVKKERYGFRFITCIRQETSSFSSAFEQEDAHFGCESEKQKVSKQRSKSRSSWKVETQFSRGTETRNANTPWTNDEDSQLQEEFYCGTCIPQIAFSHGRTRKAIIARIKKLKLM
mgnify:CR=1 FL=1